MTDIGEWFKREWYDIHEMLKTMKRETIEKQKPIYAERFVWRGSLVMVKKNGNVQINTMTDEKMEFLNQFKKRQKKQEQKTLFSTE
ncbi:MAG: hypothetical protein JSV09_01885 [Thermoplasmata archaeon]|nr:MAG: hypothetical protein JSV09_01885 [Thermoplasmata archaeon]